MTPSTGGRKSQVRFICCAACICWWKLFVSYTCIQICQVSVKKRANEDRVDTGKHMQLLKVQPCNTSLTLTIRPTGCFPFSLPHFSFLFYSPLFSHGCHIQSSTSLQVYSAQYNSSRPVLCGPEESMPLKKTEKRTIPLSLYGD